MLRNFLIFICSGGKKKSYYHDDMWNIKYLPAFLWGQLSEQIGDIYIYC